MKIFRKILVANRGEIAVRIFRSAKSLGIRTVAVYAEADHDSLHIEMADEAYRIGDNDLSETYLNSAKIIDVALKSGAEAIHPGYGFLAENAAFAEAVTKAGLVFIGPPPKAIRLMGNKIEARNTMKNAGVPLLEGYTGSKETLLEKAAEMEYPLLVKAAAGGGGKGMRIVENEKSLEAALEATSREAKSYFGDETVYIERFLENPRHIEIQIIADQYNQAVHLFERECSLQRRYQKIIEESPSPTLTDAIRHRMGETAVKIAHSIGYVNAGTIEFLVDKHLNFYFLEMNTRIQVEHPVTEQVTGIDIVREQILVASGNKLSFKQQDLRQEGHAIEARIYAENPENQFLPSPGKMTLYKEPEQEVRIDSGITGKTEIKPLYDPMISKLIVSGKTREEAIGKLLGALDSYKIHGIHTNISYLKKLAGSDDFLKNRISTTYCDRETPAIVDLMKTEKKKQKTHIPLIAYLLVELSDRHNDNIWTQIGLWRDLLTITVSEQDDGQNIRVEIHQKSPHTYIFKTKKETFEAKRYHINENKLQFCIENTHHTVYFSSKGTHMIIDFNGHQYNYTRSNVLDESQAYTRNTALEPNTGNVVAAPMHGKIVGIKVTEGQKIKPGDELLIMEAMKMENVLKAGVEGTVAKIHVKQSTQVSSGDILIEINEKSKHPSQHEKLH